MDILIKIVQFLLSLTLLVVVHELGHFIAARIFRIRVEKFYIFFNPWFSLFKFRRGQTEYGLGWVPLGGYVKIAGMIDESMDTEQMAAPPKPDEFRSKPAWQRLIVMVAGVVMNVLLAVAIYCGISYVWGERYMPVSDARWGFVWSDEGKELGFEDGDRIVAINGHAIDDLDEILNELLITDEDRHVTVLRDGAEQTVVIPLDRIIEMRRSRSYAELFSLRLPFVVDSVATSSAIGAGLQRGDRFVAINGQPAGYYDQCTPLLQQYRGQTVALTVARDSLGTTVNRELTVPVSDEGTIGVLLNNPFRLHTRHYGFWESIPEGFKRTGVEISNYWEQLKLIVSPRSKMYEELGGIIAIGSVFPSTWDWERFWHMTAMLSIILAVMNLLPIPALDGGHVLFLLWEVVTRRKPSEKFLERAQILGLLILMVLLVYANGNDVHRLLSGN